MPSELSPGDTAPRWRTRLNDFVTAVAWSPGGTFVAAASLSGEVIVLDADGNVVAKLPEHPLGALTLAWSPRTDQLAVGGQDGVLRIWQPGAENVTLALDSWVTAVAWSPNGAWLGAGAGRDLFIVTPDGVAREVFPEQPSTITALAWGSNSRRVGIACYGGPRWFEPARTTPQPARVFEWKGSLLTMAIAPSGKWLASGNQDHSVHVWRLWTGDDLEMSGYPTKVDAIAWDHRSRFLAVGGVGDVTVWDFAGKGPQGTRPRTLEGFAQKVNVVSFQRRGPLLAAGSADGLIALWDPARATHAADVVALRASVSAIDWSPDDRHVLAGTADGDVAVVSW